MWELLGDFKEGINEKTMGRKLSFLRRWSYYDLVGIAWRSSKIAQIIDRYAFFTKDLISIFLYFIAFLDWNKLQMKQKN